MDAFAPRSISAHVPRRVPAAIPPPQHALASDPLSTFSNQSTAAGINSGWKACRTCKVGQVRAHTGYANCSRCRKEKSVPARRQTKLLEMTVTRVGGGSKAAPAPKTTLKENVVARAETAKKTPAGSVQPTSTGKSANSAMTGATINAKASNAVPAKTLTSNPPIVNVTHPRPSAMPPPTEFIAWPPPQVPNAGTAAYVPWPLQGGNFAATNGQPQVQYQAQAQARPHSPVYQAQPQLYPPTHPVPPAGHQPVFQVRPQTQPLNQVRPHAIPPPQTYTQPTFQVRPPQAPRTYPPPVPQTGPQWAFRANPQPVSQTRAPQPVPQAGAQPIFQVKLPQAPQTIHKARPQPAVPPPKAQTKAQPMSQPKPPQTNVKHVSHAKTQVQPQSKPQPTSQAKPQPVPQPDTQPAPQPAPQPPPQTTTQPLARSKRLPEPAAHPCTVCKRVLPPAYTYKMCEGCRAQNRERGRAKQEKKREMEQGKEDEGKVELGKRKAEGEEKGKGKKAKVGGEAARASSASFQLGREYQFADELYASLNEALKVYFKSLRRASKKLGRVKDQDKVQAKEKVEEEPRLAWSGSYAIVADPGVDNAKRMDKVERKVVKKTRLALAPERFTHTATAGPSHHERSTAWTCPTPLSPRLGIVTVCVQSDDSHPVLGIRGLKISVRVECGPQTGVLGRG